jgi:hypothetical protein
LVSEIEWWQESVRRAVWEATRVSVRHAAVYRLRGPLQPNLIAILIAAASAVVRRRRTRASMIAVALTDVDVLLLEAAVRDSRWVMGRRMAAVPLDSVSCTPLREQPHSFELAISTDERWELFPKWDTPDAATIAKTLLGESR